MEALGVASGIAGLIGLVEIIAFKGSKFYSRVKNAQSDIKALLVEIQSLYGVLNSLKLLATCLEDHQEDERPSPESTTISSMDHFQTCRQNLDYLKKSLGKLDVDSTSVKLAWPFKSSETKELIDKIARNKRDLSDALTADGLAALVSALSSNSKVLDAVEVVQIELERLSEEKAEHEKDEHKSEVYEWCSRADPYEKHRMSKELRHPNTVLWFFDSPEYKSWVEEANSAIWLYGIPGAGKTILTSAVIEEAKILAYESPRHALAYYYCEDKFKDTQMLSNILGSLIKQICAWSDEAFEDLDDLYEKCNKAAKHLPTTEDLSKLFKGLSNHFDCIMVIIDGLDECSDLDERRKTLEILSTLNSPEFGNFKTICTSRDEVDIRGHFSKFDKISIAARGNDLELYVSAGIESRIQKKILRLKDPSLKETIIDGIVSKANGMFQWAKCQLDYLCLLSTDKERRKALETLPKDLFETYKRILDRVNDSTSGNQVLVEKTLRWLAFAEEDLTATEITTAIAIQINSKSLDEDDIPDEDSVLWWCSSMVSRYEKVLELSHFTVKEFLLDDRLLENPDLRRYHLKPETSHAILAKVCLTYVTMDEFSSFEIEEPFELTKVHDRYPFLHYAVCNWLIHSNGHDEDSGIFDLTCRLFDPLKTTQYLMWISVLFEERNTTPPRSASTLHLAASLGLTRVCEWLVENDVDINYNNKHLGTPLICAIRGVVFDENDEIDGRDPSPDTVRSLLKHGARGTQEVVVIPTTLERLDVRTSTEAKTPMSQALDLCWQKPKLYSRIFIELLDFDMYSSFATSRFWAGLDLALPRRTHVDPYPQDVKSQLVAMFKMILNHPNSTHLDPESEEKIILFISRFGGSAEDQTLVCAQTKTGRLFTESDSVAKLVEAASINGQKHTIKLLIDQGADPKQMSKGFDPAVEWEFREIVELLLEYCPLEDPDVSPNAQKAWLEATRTKQLDIMELFLKHGWDVNSKDKSGRTALEVAVSMGQYRAVEFLATVPGIDIHVRDDIDRNMLHLALHSGTERSDIVTLLLNKGVDPLQVSGNGQTVLHSYFKAFPSFNQEDLEIIQGLIRRGCSLETVDNQGNSLLHVFFMHHGKPGGFPSPPPPPPPPPGSASRRMNKPAPATVKLHSILEIIIGDGRMKSRPNKNGCLPLQVALENRLPSDLIRMAIPNDLSAWNGEDIFCPTSPLHQAVIPLVMGPRRMPGLDADHMLRMMDVLLEVKGISIDVLDKKGLTPLLSVVKNWKGIDSKKRVEAVKKLLDHGANVNARCPNNSSVLHYVAGDGSESELEEVLKSNPASDPWDCHGFSPLHAAICFGTTGKVKLLQEYENKLATSEDTVAGFDKELGRRTRGGLIPMHLAAWNGKTDVVRLLHQSGQAKSLNEPISDAQKQTPLILAARKNHLETAKALIELGADVNGVDGANQTALHLAAFDGHENMARLLVEKGANISAEDAGGAQPWMCAALKDHKSLKDFLEPPVQPDPEPEPEKLAETNGSAEVAHAPDDSSAVAVIPPDGEIREEAQTKTPPVSPLPDKAAQRRAETMLVAVTNSNTRICTALLKAGSDPNEVINKDGETALHIASWKGSIEITNVLLQHGARPTISDNFACHPVHIAAEHGNFVVLSALILKGADIRVRNRWMQTPLHLAAIFGHLDAARVLVEAAIAQGIEKEILELRGYTRRTPLFEAIENERLDVSKYLVEQGANVSHIVLGGMNALWLAGDFADKAFIETLLARGLDVNNRSFYGFNTICNVACRDLSFASSAKEAETDICLMLIKAGADYSWNNPAKVTPLHGACHSGNKRLVEELLKLMPQGAVNVESRYYGTPLWCASFRGHVEIVRILLENGAEVECRMHGESAVEAAYKEGHEDVVKLLKGKGAALKEEVKEERVRSPDPLANMLVSRML